MVRYKVNIIFKEDGKTLNEVITEALKIELQKRLNIICINNKSEPSCYCTDYSRMEWRTN